ncbi:hypothetical protein FEM03_23790 [Phragmitibacter flavus]|uniref:Porin family protein n=1 Tax=Phragmitibacter flavus TaxID=2576071 RepID=A0A5R8K798_9BACT|nr:hypothetical protein [Phragmitibacter flavus]TLD68233.1 hypothetical protein FEM03_23790 [Phragmitibacter flavus]
MKKFAITLFAMAFASAAIAGPVSYGKSSKEVAPLPPPPPLGCESFAPGFAFGLYGAAILPDGDSDNELGAGFLAEYFFTEYVGVQGSYSVFATEQEHHEFNGALVLRYPIKSICLAPYVLAGGGYSVNSDNRGNYFVGGGLEYRIESANLGIFGDGAYHFAEDSADEDYTIVRLGVKFPF